MANAPRSTRTEKVMYIAEHPELLGASNKIIVTALKGAGLVFPKTSPIDIRSKTLFDEARSVIARKYTKGGK
jgi:hypothetical protein